MTLSIPRLPPDALEEAECPRRDIADGEQRDYSHHRLLMRAHPHLYLTCGLRTHPGHPCPPPFPQLTQPRRSAIVSCAPTPTIPRSDHNKDAVIRPGTLRFPYAQTAERAPISCLFLGDTRLGEGRTISLPRSTLTGAAAKPTAPPIPGRRRVPDDAVARSSICHPFRGRRSILSAHSGHRDAMYAIDNQDPEGGQAWGSSA